MFFWSRHVVKHPIPNHQKSLALVSMAQLYVNDLPIRYGDVAIDGLLDMI